MRAPLALLLLASACASEPAVDAPALGTVEQSMAVCADSPTTVYGIDVSRFQGSIDWQLVKSSGVVYAYIQISRSLTDIDAKFSYNWQRAKEVGILRGAYQRFQPDQDVIGQANLFLQKLGPFQPGDLPPMLDVEDAGGLTGPQIAQKVKQWMDHVEPIVGVKPLIYTGFYFWRDQVGGADFADHPLWIANYGATCPLVPPTWNRWAFHQYSSTAVIPGITENTVDVNKFNGTLAQLKALGMPAVPATCGDEACSADEDPDTCPVDCEPCQLIGASEAGEAVDDSSSCFVAGGDASGIREENAGYGSSLKWTYTTDDATAQNYGQWNLHFEQAGRYHVEAYTAAPFNESSLASYEIQHAGMTTAVTVDQGAVAGWNGIGDFEFAAGGSGQHVRANDNTGEALTTQTRIVFDALRFTRLADAPGGDGPDGEDEPDSGGCAAHGGAGWLAMLGVALVGARRRRRALRASV